MCGLNDRQGIPGYRPPTPAHWTGRVDDPEDPEAFRWHQTVEQVDLRLRPLPKPSAGQPTICLIGFCSDEGVIRNLGRPGAAKGPAQIRQALANLPSLYRERARLCDLGDITGEAGADMETIRTSLSQIVATVAAQGGISLVLGGGHELASAHFAGLSSGLTEGSANGAPRIGIINFDAHLDLRPLSGGRPSSGTSFREIAEAQKQRGEPFSYWALGIQLSANTESLFRAAKEFGVRYTLARDITPAALPTLQRELLEFANAHDALYVTVCADVFNAAHAPGVSAPQPFGLAPEPVLELLRPLWKTGRIAGFDIAEVSPRFDADNRTAQLAAVLVFAFLNTLAGVSPSWF